jgi:hypothetical protein
MGILLRQMETTVFNMVEKRSEGTPKGSGLSPNVRWSGPEATRYLNKAPPVNP